MLEDRANIKVSGKILESLSKLLPTNVTALNELVKNAYDAEATQVELKWDEKNDVLEICDDGSGMSKEDIENLFSIGRSHKQYGIPFSVPHSSETRYKQGAKGLGFLAGFRFGDKIIWETSTKGEAWRFECDLKTLEESVNLGKEEIVIRKIKRSWQGTKIQISLSPNGSNRLTQIIDNEGGKGKLVNLFRETNMKIKIFKNQKELTCEYLSHMYDCQKKRQRFYVRKELDSDYVTLFHNGQEIQRFLAHQIDETQLSLELIIFDLSGGTTKFLPEMYRKGRELSPLVYINHNLFDSSELFDPGARRSQRSQEALPQMIGYIDVISAHPELEFNIDRTRLVQNDYSDELKKVLEMLNSDIQKAAAKYKKQHKDEDSYKQGNAPPSKEHAVTKGRIDVSHSELHYVRSSPEINLSDIILSATDNESKQIDCQSIEVFVDGKHTGCGVIPSQRQPGNYGVDFKHVCKNGDSIEQHITLIIERKQANPKANPPLFPFIPEADTYNDHLEYSKTIMREITELYSMSQTGKKSFYNVISCALRSIYEFVWKSLIGHKNLPAELKVILKKGKGSNIVKGIIDYLKSDPHRMKDITDVTADNFSTIMNLDLDEVVKQYKQANVGAHNGASYYTTDVIRSIATQAALFYRLVLYIHEQNK